MDVGGTLQGRPSMTGDRALMFVSVSVNVNATSSECVFACLHAGVCVCMPVCWLSMKQNAVWMSGLSHYSFNMAFCPSRSYQLQF